MRKVLVSLMVLSLVPALATAAVTNPEGFEGYALTTDWNPTLAVEGWNIVKMYGVDDGQLASIVDDGGTQILDINSQGGYGMVGSPMWDADGPPDSAAAVTKSGFDIKPISHSMGNQFVAKFARHPDTNPWYQCTWEVGIRVGKWSDFGTPYGPLVEGTSEPNGTYVYLRTWVGPEETYTETPIPGYGVGEFIIPHAVIAPDVIPEWYTVEIEEDNVLSKTRARMYLRGGTPSTWTDWMDHNAAVTYAGTEGQVFGWMGGQMQMDNWYIESEGGPAGNPGDANNDDVVSADDYGSVQLNFGATGAVNIPGDANLDGVVSADDYGSVQVYFGTVYGAGGASVPEPATMLLLGAGSLLLLKRKRKS